MRSFSGYRTIVELFNFSLNNIANYGMISSLDLTYKKVHFFVNMKEKYILSIEVCCMDKKLKLDRKFQCVERPPFPDNIC
jgi:hypothetical protein